MPNIHKAAKVAEYKKEIVKRLADLIRKCPIIGLVNMENLPAAQLQKMKAQLRGKVELFMTKKRLMGLAIEQAKAEKKGIEKIEEHLKGMPALLFTSENPFTLFKTLKKSKTKAPAKPGQTAPSDIVIKAGPTPFAPGPVIGELGALGIKTKVEAGKIAILEDAVVCKEGEEISLQLAGMLVRLGIEPMEVGLDIVAVYEDGEIFTKSVLDIDEDKFMADLNQAARWALNLSCETVFLTDANKELLLQKAFMDAKALALSQDILADAVVEELLSKAERQMQSLKSQLPEAPEPKAEEKKEEAKVEEKPAEPAKEEPKAEGKVEPKTPEPVEKPVKEKKEEAKEEKVEKKEEAKEVIFEKAKKPEKKPEEPKPEEKPKEIPEKVEEPKQEIAKPEEPKVEEKPEEKAPEPKEEEKPKEIPEKVEEKKQEIAKPEEPKVEEKVKNIVEQMKIKEKGVPTAEKLVEEVGKEEAEQKKEKEKQKAELEKVEELAQRLVKKGTLQDVTEKEKEKKPKKKKKKSKEEKSEVEKVEDLTRQLLKKGTLRK